MRTRGRPTLQHRVLREKVLEGNGIGDSRVGGWIDLNKRRATWELVEKKNKVTTKKVCGKGKIQLTHRLEPTCWQFRKSGDRSVWAPGKRDPRKDCKIIQNAAEPQAAMEGRVIVVELRKSFGDEGLPINEEKSEDTRKKRGKFLMGTVET